MSNDNRRMPTGQGPEAKSKDRIQLSDHFTPNRLLKFVYPAILMMIFSSIYSVVDGLFVSNFAGKIPFAAVNMVMPLLTIMSTLGFMIGTGGSAVVGIALGEKKPEQANRYFSMFIYTLIGMGVIVTIVCQIFLEPIVRLLGADDTMFPYCVTYGRITMISITMFMLQVAFQTLFNTAEKPKLGLYIIVLAGCTNMVLDAIMVGVLHWGVAGAAIATVISEFIGGGIPLLYFARKNDSLLRLVPARIEWRVLGRACFNGSSEMMNSLASSIVTVLYNYQFMRFIGSDGVAAYGAIMYVMFIFLAIFLGFSFGCAPIMSYHYGAGNTSEMKNLFRISIGAIGIFAVAMMALAELSSGTLTQIFVGYDSDLYHMTLHGFRIYGLMFLFAGFNIYTSSLFTSLGDGLTSAAVAFMRTLVFEVCAVLVLPMIFGAEGLWWATVTAEVLAILVSGTFLLVKRNRFHYL